MNTIWFLQPESKYQKAKECVEAVVSRLQNLLETDGLEIITRLEPDSIDMLSIQLKLCTSYLLAASRELREVEQERRALVKFANNIEQRINPSSIDYAG